MILQLGQQIQRLQAINPESLEEVVVGTQFFPRHLEVRRRKLQNLVKRLFRPLPNLPQPSLPRRTRKQLTENINFPPQLLMWNRLDKLLRRRRRRAIKLSQLCSRGPRRPQRLAFAHHLADQADLLRLGGFNAAPRQQQIPDHSITQIPLQPRDPAKPRNQPQPELRKTKPRHLVGNNQIASQRQLESSPEGHSMHRRNRSQWRSIEQIQHAVDALQKIPHALCGLSFLYRLRALVQFAQIRPRAKPRLQPAINNEGVRLALHKL